uniref:Putative secreted mucin n=1 Tax=Amblyomma triste TaxID=251400 RepID=A0A023G1H2_AMBTT
MAAVVTEAAAMAPVVVATVAADGTRAAEAATVMASTRGDGEEVAETSAPVMETATVVDQCVEAPEATRSVALAHTATAVQGGRLPEINGEHQHDFNCGGKRG